MSRESVISNKTDYSRCGNEEDDDFRQTRSLAVSCDLDEKISPPSKTVLSRNLDATEFGQDIANWFGQKGFNAMRSFFRSSVLNALQLEKIGHSRKKCSDFEIAIVLLIADHFLSTGCNFTMSVFVAEILKPMAYSNPVMKDVHQRIGKTAKFDRFLSKDDVVFVSKCLNVDPFSPLGAKVLDDYCNGRNRSLLCVLLKILKQRVSNFSGSKPSVDRTLTTAFNEGIQEEFDKFHSWFAQFSSQFTDASSMLREMCRLVKEKNGRRRLENEDSGKVTQLWDKVSSIVDDHLKEKRATLTRLRDEERRKLAVYAKELDALRREMNVKLEAVRNYENILKAKEKALNDGSKGQFHENLIYRVDGKRGNHDDDGGDRGDYVKYSNSIEKTAEKRELGCYCGGDFNPSCNENSKSSHGKQVGLNKLTVSLLEENAELKSAMRQQQLKIDILAKRCTSLTSALYKKSVTNGRLMSFRNELPKSPLGPVISPVRCLSDQLLAPLADTVVSARSELDRLKEEQQSADWQYQVLINWKNP